MQFSSPTKRSLTQDVVGFNNRLRDQFANLPEGDRAKTENTLSEVAAIATWFDGQIDEIQARAEVAQQAATRDPARAQAMAAAHRMEITEAIERAVTGFDRVAKAVSADRAALDTTLEHVASGRLVLNKNGLGATLRPATEPTSNEAAGLQQMRATLRALPKHELETHYLNAVTRGDNSQLVKAVESASQVLPLVSKQTIARARQLRVDHYTAGTQISQTQQALALREMGYGHAERAIQERIAGLKM